MGCGYSNHGDQIFIDQTKDKGQEIKVSSTLENIDEHADEDSSISDGNKNLVAASENSNKITTVTINKESFSGPISYKELIENVQENKEECIQPVKSKTFMGLPTKNTDTISRSQADFFEMLDRKINDGPEISDYELES
ncbi:hypothetical protein TrispH2_003501 [Trichoplax sp. H2]|nr:hypothetical protein TrispH2_003501 [Trichoplax sp. H2]|eukprot:RDD43899.1 hypothetical protein TrispH2_003501 [Trichoplax sp. H2]